MSIELQEPLGASEGLILPISYFRDLRMTVRDIRLGTEDRVMGVQYKELAKPPKIPSVLIVVKNLANAERLLNVGESGPCNAATATEENKDDPEFNLFKALFGRDSLRMAMDGRSRHPALLRSTIASLASLQGITYRIKSEEEPGKIIHEYRDESDAQGQKISKEVGWQWPYYGSVDATLSYVIAVAEYVKIAPEGKDFLQKIYIGKDGKSHTLNSRSLLLWGGLILN